MSPDVSVVDAGHGYTKKTRDGMKKMTKQVPNPTHQIASIHRIHSNNTVCVLFMDIVMNRLFIHTWMIPMVASWI
jgi:hypothetical protein